MSCLEGDGLCLLPPPLDVSEAGLDLLGRDGEGGSERERPPLALRERPEEAGDDIVDDSGAEPNKSSSSPSDLAGDGSPLSGPHIDSVDLLRLADDAFEVIGESGTDWPAPSEGLGGGRSGPTMPPTFRTPGSRRRMMFTSSSEPMGN